MPSRNKKGQFKKGYHHSPETEFKKGEHWREEKPFWNKDWLKREYQDNFRSAQDIAEQFDITEGAILYWLRKHNIERRDMSEIRQEKHWGAEGEENGMYGRTGEDNPNWRGGISPERQAFYSSQEWIEVANKVWKRDNGTCQRCGREKKVGEEFHIHHIVSFENEDLRTDLDNLVLLCKNCHNWVHSKENKDNKFIKNE